MKLIIFTDGASRGNPGHASYGFTISDDTGKLLYEEGRYIGITTNNMAEYTAVAEALKKAGELYPDERQLEIDFFMDSRLVVEQLSGRFKIKSAHLKPIIDRIKSLALETGPVFFTHIPREKNTAADRLANQALDSRI